MHFGHDIDARNGVVQVMRLLLLAILALGFAAGARAQTLSGGSGSSAIASGTTSCSGGSDKAVFFNDGGVANCGSTTLTFDKTTGQLAATSLKSVSSALGTVLNLNNSVVIATDASNVLAVRNGANAQSYRVYNTFTDASNGEWGAFDWSTTANTLTIGTKANGTGTVRGINLDVGGATAVTFSSTLAAFGVAVSTPTFRVTNINNNNSSNTVLTFTNGSANALFATGATAPLFQFAGTTSSFPALKRSSAALQVRLADDSAFALIQGKHQTDTAYTAGVTTATGYLVLYDSTGTAYKVNACTGC